VAKKQSPAVLLLGLILFSCQPHKSRPEQAADEILETLRAGYPVTDQFSEPPAGHAAFLTDALWRRNDTESADAFARFKETARLRREYFPIPVGLRGWQRTSELFYTDTVRLFSHNALARCDDLTYTLDLQGRSERWSFIMVEDIRLPGRNQWRCGQIRPNH
jgi:hypothetical protein